MAPPLLRSLVVALVATVLAPLTVSIVVAGSMALAATPAGGVDVPHVYHDAGMIGFGSVNTATPAMPQPLDSPVFSGVATPDGNGYLLASADGGVFAFGDAQFAGSCPGIGGCAGAAVAVLPAATGSGYWVVTKTGAVYGFGDAGYFGAPGAQTTPITSAVATPDGGGYYVMDGAGQVFAYGDANYLGGAPAGSVNGFDPATAIFATADGRGYWIATALGKVFTFGDAPNAGDESGTHLNGPIVGATGW